MTAARVLNPVMLSELCKFGASPVKMGRNMNCGRQLTRIKRDLFGPVNTNEINKIFNEEMEKQQEQAKVKWGFDFRTGCPIASNNSQYLWERISTQESIYAPEVYTLTRAAHVRPLPTISSPLDLLMDERSDRENSLNSSAGTIDTDSCDEMSEDAELSFKLPTVVAPAPIASRALGFNGRYLQGRRRQPKITEFMKERKRLAQSVKKMSPPAKRARTASGGSSSSSIEEKYARATHAQPLRARK